MFYIIKDEKLQLASDDREKLNNTLELMPQLKNERVLETDIIIAKELELCPNKVIVSDIEIEIDVDDFEQERKVGSHKETIVVKGLVLNPDFENEEQTKERDRLNHLSLTKREVFLALYRDKGLTPEMIRSQIKDPEALIEFDYANEYFRGNPLIEKIGIMLGYTTEQLDNLFENGKLI